MNLYLDRSDEEEKGSAVVSFALVTPLIIFVSVSLIQMILLLITYATISTASERGARLLTMGKSKIYAQQKMNEELNKFRFFRIEPEINISQTKIVDEQFLEIEITAPVKIFFGVNLELKSISHGY
ncbi:MAG: hypothetical protein RIS18_567 [Actinomycetota bacterium]